MKELPLLSVIEIQNSDYFTVSQICLRPGWTRLRVKTILGQEDATAKSPFFENSAPLRLWLKSRVLDAEERGLLQTKRKAFAFR